MGGFPYNGYSCINLKLGRSSGISNFEYASCNAISMASNGIGSLAHMESVNTSRSSLLSCFLGLDISFDAKVYHCARLILFSVIVPVLSVQITVALPRVSTVFVCLTMIPIFIKRQAPRAIKVVKATGISSGIILIAKVKAFSKLSRRSLEL